MWLFSKKSAPRRAPQIQLINSLSGNKELFVPVKAGSISLYTCGPTVYSRQHIGNLRAAMLGDSIARLFIHAGYAVKRVINITDVGHLVDDVEEGEDKMAVGAAREKKTPSEIAEHFAKLYIDDLDDLNVDTSSVLFPRATEYIKEQIAMAKALEEKGFAYRIPEGLYFDVTKFSNYGRLGNIGHAVLKSGARVPVVRDKRHPSDFALWRTAKPNDLQQWDSPWGRGNPGWHIECSAMIRALLGIEIDVHTGGEDLAHVHHNDEIAQSESVNGRPLAKYWLHNAFLNVEGEKISKSLGNVFYLSDITDRDYNPLALRYLFLTAHYRSPLSFSWEALAAANEALERLWKLSGEIKKESEGVAETSSGRDRFIAAVHDDLGTPQALGILWESLKSEDFSPEEKWGLIEAADALLGLSLVEPPLSKLDIPEDIRHLLARRNTARINSDYVEADKIREEILARGYLVEDGPKGPVLSKRPTR